MNLEYKKLNEMTFIGYYTSIKIDEGYEKCPEFWDKEYAEKYQRLFTTRKSENDEEQAVLENGIGMYALCVNNDNDFQYWIDGEYKGGKVPENLSLFTFPESQWALFSTKGPIPSSIQELNTYIWDVWMRKEGQELGANVNATIEVYSMGNPRSPEYESGIWIPISKKPE